MKIPGLWHPVIHLPNGLKAIVPKSYIRAGHNRSYLGSFDDIYIDKEYELLPNYKPSTGDIVFDIGSFIGLYALKCSILVGEEGKVYAVEPLPLNYEYLLRNIQVNNLNNIIPINSAVMDFEGFLSLYCDNLRPSRSTAYKEHIGKELNNIISNRVKVKATTLDNLISQHKIRLVNLLKIDVEGAELNVLRGGFNALNTGIIERIIIEIHERVINPKDIITLLKSMSYNINGYFALPYLRKMLYAKLRL